MILVHINYMRETDVANGLLLLKSNKSIQEI